MVLHFLGDQVEVLPGFGASLLVAWSHLTLAKFKALNFTTRNRTISDQKNLNRTTHKVANNGWRELMQWVKMCLEAKKEAALQLPRHLPTVLGGR